MKKNIDRSKLQITYYQGRGRLVHSMTLQLPTYYEKIDGVEAEVKDVCDFMTKHFNMRIISAWMGGVNYADKNRADRR